jgi:hypothetical protein
VGKAGEEELRTIKPLDAGFCYDEEVIEAKRRDLILE